MAVTMLKKLSAVFLPLILIIGVYDYFTNFEENNCNMTYMYEMPVYVPIKLNKEITKKFPRYKLYAYGEGRYAENLREHDFYGVPVLFIPGNAGSYKQVRSLASVAYRMSVDYSFYFNYFSADLNEEYSALYGSVLQTQTEFIHECIKKIIKLYKPSPRITVPCSVILVGHSMGGVLARALFTLPNFDATSVNVIFTQATPHQPIAYFDNDLKLEYEKINKFWIDHRQSSLSHVNFVTIGGGHRDVMVRSSLTSIPQNNSFDMDLQRLTSAVPRVWLSCDHNGIVWCKQLVLTTQRAMFDLVDPQTKQLIVIPQKRATILHYHFVRKTSRLSFDAVSRLNSTSIINPKGSWVEQRKSSWSYVQAKVTALNYFAIPIRRDGNLIVTAKHVPFHDWLMMCKATEVVDNKTVCVEGKVITRARLLPTEESDKKFDRKFAILRLTDWRAFSHALVQVQPSAFGVEVFSEVYDPKDRHVSLSVPYWPYNLLFTSLKVNRTEWNALFYNITLTDFSALWQAYKVTITPLTKKCKPSDVGVLRFYVPWNEEDVYTFIKSQNVTTTVVKLQSPRLEWQNGFPQLHVFLDPRCSYRIAIAASFSDILGQVIRYYWCLLVVLSVAILVELLSFQLSSYLSEGKCPSILDSFSVFRLIGYVVVPSYIFLCVLHCKDLIESFELSFLSETFPLESRTLHHSFFFLSLFIFALILVQTIARLISFPVFLIGNVNSLLFYKYFKHDPGHLKSRPNFPLRATVFSASIFSCAYSFCGSPMLLFGLIIYLFKVGYLNGKLNSAINRGRDITRLSISANTHFTLLILWFFGCILNIPSLLVWVKNINYDLDLNPDHSLPITAVLVTSLSFVWDEEGPRVRRSVCWVIVWLLRISSVLVVCLAMDSVYLLSHFISLVFILIDALYAFCLRLEKQD